MNKNKAISNKIKQIMHEGVRKNTRKAVSSKNPRRKVPQRQAIAIAENMAKRGKI